MRRPLGTPVAEAVAADTGLCMDMRESARLRSPRQLLSRIAVRHGAVMLRHKQHGEASMTRNSSLYASVAVIAVAAWMSAPSALHAQQSAPPAVSIGDSDLGGVVSGPNGPEAGVWVIAETTDLPTKFAKIVVTDDQGRYVLPDLPKANYNVWVRGYGLVDSPKVASAPGKTLNLTAVPAPNAAAAAE
jgi:hypothetical protein